MRKEYTNPQIRVVKIAMRQHLLEGSTPQYSGGGRFTPESREYRNFDDEEESE